MRVDQIKRFLTAFMVLVFLAMAGAAQDEQYLMPIDEGPKNPSFAVFRKNLIAAIKRRDAKYVLSILDPKIRIDFGGGGGVAAFKEQWDGLDPTGRFWREFLKVISNGGTFSKEPNERDGIFWAPYVFDAFPPDLDSYEHAAIIGKDVKLRAKPNMNGEIVASLSYNIVKIDRDELDVPDEGLSPAEMAYTGKQPEPFFWVKVVTLGGKTGYVKDDYVHGPVDYRASFEKKRGRWVMTAFINGD